MIGKIWHYAISAVLSEMLDARLPTGSEGHALAPLARISAAPTLGAQPLAKFVRMGRQSARVPMNW